MGLTKQIHALRASLAERRRSLDAEWAELETQKSTLATASFLPFFEGEDDIETLPAKEVHDAQMEALQRATLDEEAKVAKLKVLLADLQSAASRDAQLHVAKIEQAPAAAPSTEVMMPAPAAADPTVHDEAAAQRAELAAERATARKQRAAILQAGAMLHRWDPHTRILRPCTLSLVGGGRCLQCTPIDGEGEGPFLMPLHRVEHAAPSVAVGAFRGGTIPTHCWLYFSVQWARQPSTSGDSTSSTTPQDMRQEARVNRTFGAHTVVLPSPGDAPAAAHFACRTRAEVINWIVGLREAGEDATAARRLQEETVLTLDELSAPTLAHTVRPPSGSVGSVLWQVIAAKIAEQARDRGERPLQMLAQAVRQAAADASIVRLDGVREARLSVHAQPLAGSDAAPALVATAAAPGPAGASTPTKGRKKGRRRRGE